MVERDVFEHAQRADAAPRVICLEQVEQQLQPAALAQRVLADFRCQIKVSQRALFFFLPAEKRKK